MHCKNKEGCCLKASLSDLVIKLIFCWGFFFFPAHNSEINSDFNATLNMKMDIEWS